MVSHCYTGAGPVGTPELLCPAGRAPGSVPRRGARPAHRPACRARSTFLSNLPTVVFGTSSMKAQFSGTCHGATLPSRNAASVGRGRPSPRVDHDAGQRALGPLLVGDADRRRPRRRPGAPASSVLQLDRGDPLPAGLDHVLGPVGDLEVAAVVDGADVAGAQPAVVELLRRRRRRSSAPVIHGPRTSISPTDFPSQRQPRAVVVDDAHLRPRQRAARSSPASPSPRRCPARRRPAEGQRADRGVSVMPQPWMMRTPYRFWNASISDRGTAAPPDVTIRSDDRSSRAGRRAAGCRPRSSGRPRPASAARPR